jgi:two-component system chemotaxis sensor kinase CheA
MWGLDNMDVSQYLEIFIDETQMHLQELNDNILILEKEPDNKDTVNEIFRAAHSLKGMAGTMGFKRMQRLTHDMENVFQEVRSDNIAVTQDIVDIVFQCLDALEEYLENVKATSSEGTEDNEAIINRLNEMLHPEEAAAKPQEGAQQDGQSKEGASQEPVNKMVGTTFDDNEKQAINAAKEIGKKIYAMTVYIEENCMLKAARAFLVIKAVEDYGKIIKYVPSAQEIEDEKFERDFGIVFTTSEEIEEIVEAAKSVSEIETVLCDDITETALAEKKAPVEEKPKETAVVPAAETKPAPAAPAKPAEKKPAAKPANKPVASRTVRVDIEKLDALMNQVSELIIAKNSLVAISGGNGTEQDSASSKQQFQENIEYLERITTNLHESVMKVRMVPIESVVNKFPRMIRDLSKKLDKKMELVMTGEDTELDRTVVDEIGDPLQHLLRNSADHGLESNELRKQRGKPEVGTIFLDAFQEGNNVIIEVGDDGNGIDADAVMSKAIERGVITQEQSETMSRKEIIDLLFLPSFSMAKKISDISGRGVGLDVVKSKIEALGGDVEVKTTLGEGTKFIVRLPLTLAIIQALMVELRDEKYAIALGTINNIEDIPVSDIKYVEGKEVINIRGTVIPIIRLDQMLDIPPKEEEPESLTVVIISKGEKQAGLVVDNLIGQQEVVIKSLGSFINNNKLISGATILGNGDVALILDINAMI